MPSKASKHGCNSLGVYFATGTQYFNIYTIPPVTPQSDTLTTLPITDTSKWFHYVDIYTATGTETDIMIGNFRPDAQINTPVINNDPFVSGRGAYFVVDDVSLHEMSLDIGDDVTICTGTALTIGEQNLDTAFNGYYWYHNGILFDSLVDQKTLTFFQPDSFVVEKRLPCGSVFDTIRVNVSYDACLVKELNITEPNVFTPNGDGINDVFEIKLSGSKFLLKQFQIKDRWGITVHDQNTNALKVTNVSDIQNTSKTIYLKWDSRTSSGISCSDGVYYYFLEVENEKGELIKRNGYITLLR